MDNQDSFQKHLEAGKDFCESGKYSEARVEFQKAIELNSSDVEVHDCMGISFAREGKHDEAIFYYKKAIELDFNYVAAYVNWGNILYNLNQDDEAIIKYKEAIKIDSNYFRAYYNWAHVLEKHKKYRKANALYKKATKINPNYAKAYYNWGNNLSKLKRYEEAINKLQKAIQIKNNYAIAYYNMGVIFYTSKRYEEAINQYEKAIEYDPSFAYAHNNNAETLWIEGRYEEAWQKWRHTRNAFWVGMAKKDNFRKPDFYQHFGDVLSKIFDDLDKAEEIYLEGLKLDQNHIGILMGLMNLYLRKRNEEYKYMAAWHWRAIEKFNQLKRVLEERMKKDDYSAFSKLGEACLRMELYEDAEQHLWKALKKLREKNNLDAFSEDHLANIYANLGVLFICTGLFKKAVQKFEEALKLSPANQLKIRYNLAEAYFKANQREKAEVEYKKILSVTQAHVESHIGLGDVYTAMGDDGDWEMYQQAIYHYSQAMKLSRTETGSKKLKKYELAAVHYSRGVARVRYFETAKIWPKKSFLHDALVDFQKCHKNDPDHHKSAQASKKVRNFLSLSPMRFLERFGPMLITWAAFSAFLISSLAFIFHTPCKITAGYYALLSFGSIVFMIAGLYLPQILKLKVGPIEIEKIPLSQITTPSSLGLGITK